MYNLIQRIIDLATERVFNKVSTNSVIDAVCERMIDDGIVGPRQLADHIDLSYVATNIDLSDLADEFDVGDVASYVSDALMDSETFGDRLTEAVENANTLLNERVAALERARDASPTTPTEAVEVPANLTDKLLDLAVERLLKLADDAVRDGKV